VHYLYKLAPFDDALPISLAAPGTYILSLHITLAICKSIVRQGLLNSGYNPTHVSAHLLLSSGAMTLQLNNLGENLINNWVAGQAPLSSLTSTRKSSLSPQVYRST
jgi:hypothetical protein